MSKYLVLVAAATCLALAGCQPVLITKTYTEVSKDASGKTITYEESVSQIPGKLPPIHLKNADLYK